MKISLNWLREYVELPESVPALCELLTLAGVEVEGIENRGVAIEKVVVAQILESNPHPNADRLSVCRVDDGGEKPRQIVCGAKNYKVGDKVPLAQPGAVLPGDFKIKVGKLRGVESEGMMCSAKELQLAEDAAGLLILPPDTKVGTPLTELFPAETVLDLEVTPNRPDLLSHIGMAREVAALTGKPLKRPAVETAASQADSSLQLNAGENAPFYSARRITGVKVGPSPAWLQQKLEAVGIRSINNVVDITNLVMLEQGQPLHAFDADKLAGNVQARFAEEGEEFLALDGRTYKLNTGDIAIADSNRVIALGGVMGGEETGVTETTVNVLLESAYFEPASIRRTARRLGLISDSSYRFERGVDPEGILTASQRATDLILELAGGEAEPTIGTAGTLPDFRRTVPLAPNRCNEVLGTEVPQDRIDAILSGLGLVKEGDAWEVPSFRQDLTREIDLIEEVTRVFGIDQIPSRTLGKFAPSSQPDQIHDRNMAVRRALVARGFFEARTLTLISEKTADADVLKPAELRRVRNPLNEDQVVLRPNLVPGLIGVLGNNVRAGAKDIRIFEVGRVFRAEGQEERLHLGVILSGGVTESSWREAKVRQADLFDLKGVLASLGLGAVEFEKTENPAVALAATVVIGGKAVGQAGQLWPAQARALDVNAPVLFAEIDLGALEISESRTRRVEEIEKYPAVTRDIAIVAPTEVTHAQILAHLRESREPLLAGVELFDLFSDPTGERVPVGQKSLAYSLTYRAKERTLTSDEVNAAHGRLKESLKAAFAVTFRE